MFPQSIAKSEQIGLLPLAQLVTLLVTLCCSLAAEADWNRQHRDIMGTRISVELWHPNTLVTDRCSKQIFAEMNRIDAVMSPYRSDSEISNINNNAAVVAVEISDEMQWLLDQSVNFSNLSRGAFDITYASIGNHYDYRKSIRPSELVVARTMPAIDYKHLVLENKRLKFAHAGVKIDLGGIAKGYAVDRAIGIVKACQIKQALISAGGDSRILGDKQGRPWIIGIQHPRNPDETALLLPLSDTAISTSGDYQRFFIEDGERIHHIINPQTGRSASGILSATVIGPDAMTTDALSTTIFVLGVDQGINLIESLDGIDAVVIDSNGKLHYSSGLQP